MDYSLKDKILATVTIDGYIGRFVTLKGSGNSLKGLCPFHNEKSPSFTVSPNKGLFYCFGCGKGGDIFRFVMERDAIPFAKALTSLAQYAGIKIDSKTSKASSKRENLLLKLNEDVMHSFSTYLHSTDGLAHRHYLQERAISDESIKFFKIGASPKSWNWLKNKHPSKEKEMLDLGLLRKKDKSKSSYDFFRNRIIFPISSPDNKIQGFGGRTITNQDTEAKYINSTDSITFKKNRLLYGLAQNITEMRMKQEALCVEGYLDVIGLWQAGIAFACAPLGTALSLEHIKLLSRYVKSITFLFDGDIAGLNAAHRSVKLCLNEANLECFVCLLPAGCDPFDLAKSQTKSQINKLLDNKISGSKFFLMEAMLPHASHTLQENNKNNFSKFISSTKHYYDGNISSLLPQGMQKRKALDRLYEHLLTISKDTDCRLFLESAAQILKLNTSEVQQEWERNYKNNNISSKLYSNKSINKFNAPSIEINSDIDNKDGTTLTKSDLSDHQKKLIQCERQLVLELLFNPSLFANFIKELNQIEFEDLYSDFLWRHLESRYLIGNIWTKEKLMNLELPEEIYEVFTPIIAKHTIEKEHQLKKHSALGEYQIQEAYQLIKDYFLKHKILEHEKNIDAIEATILVSDLVQKTQLLKKEGELICELNILKNKWRNQN